MIAELVEEDDLKSFKAFNLTTGEIEALRFDLKMNFLQLVCHEEATNILKWLTLKLQDHPQIRKKMAKYRD